MNVELKRIAEKKLEQLGGDVCGVLVRKDGRLAAVDEHGRVTWLRDRQGTDLCRCIGPGNGCCCDRCDPSMEKAARPQSGDKPPQIMGRVYRDVYGKEGEPVPHLNSEGRKLPDGAALYAEPVVAQSGQGEEPVAALAERAGGEK